MYLKNKTVVVHFVTLSLHYHEDYYTHNIVSSEFVEEKGQLLNGSLRIPESKFNYIYRVLVLLFSFSLSRYFWVFLISLLRAPLEYESKYMFSQDAYKGGCDYTDYGL